VPFSDPSAEGPTIQKAHERALDNKMGMDKLFELVSEFREQDQSTPIVLMGYANPIEWMGYEVFVSRSKQAGVDAALTVDIPPEEAEPLNLALEAEGLYNVFLIAPTTTEERIEQIANMASGFIYYVSLKGVTGSNALDVQSVEEKLAQIRAKTDLPVCVGFGIKEGEIAKVVAELSDGVVVGSAIVDAAFQAESKQVALDKVGTFVSSIRSSID